MKKTIIIVSIGLICLITFFIALTVMHETAHQQIAFAYGNNSSIHYNFMFVGGETVIDGNISENQKLAQSFNESIGYHSVAFGCLLSLLFISFLIWREK